jgi:hypothetical protein
MMMKIMEVVVFNKNYSSLIGYKIILNIYLSIKNILYNLNSKNYLLLITHSFNFEKIYLMKLLFFLIKKII